MNARKRENPNSMASIRARVNAGFTAVELIRFIGWHPDRIQKLGDVYLALCPIHRDSIFRTLQLNPRNNTYQCRHTSCSGYAPADYIDLLIKVQKISPAEVILAAVNEFGLEYFHLNDEQFQVIKDQAEQDEQARLIKENTGT